MFSNHLNILLRFLLLLAVVLAPATGMAAGASSPEIARVDGHAVRRTDLDRELKLIQLKMERQGRPVSAARLQRYAGEIRETLINRILLQEKARSGGVTTGARQVAKAMEEFKAGFQDEDAYRKALADMGFSEAALTEQIRNGLTIKSLLDRAVLQKIFISDKRIRAFYEEHPDLFRQPEQVRASHILIKLPAGADEATRAEALAAIRNLKMRIDAGEKFAVLAMDNSDDSSRTRGGDLGFFSRDQVPGPFADAAFSLAKGQVSDVVTTRFGYHLINVTDRKAARTMAFVDVKEMIVTRLRREQEEKKIGNYLEKLREGADIKRFPL